MYNREANNMTKFLQYKIQESESPFWAFAIHDGHQIDTLLEPFFNIDEAARLREEDPYTASMAELPINQLFMSTSRFQLDVNRSKEDAVYLRPDQAWGLQVWKKALPPELLQELYIEYEQFYSTVDKHIQRTIDKYNFFVVFDVHSYNAQRLSEEEPVDKKANPQINLGTSYNQEKWRPIIEEFVGCIRRQRLFGESIDIRENIKFKGGYLAQHILQKYGGHGCVLSIEFRKDFMNEWTGLPYEPLILEYKQLLLHVLKYMQKLDIYGVK